MLVDGNTLSTVVSALTIVGLLVGAIVTVLRQRFRIDRLEERLDELHVDHAEMREDIKAANKVTQQNYEKILAKFDALTTEITKLTISLNNLEFKHEQK